jgi:dihydropteroate synthase
MMAAKIWRVKGKVLALDRPLIMGILNVTPDSFSDGGRFFSVDDAVARAHEMVREGADIVDLGGESTRPQGALPVDAEEEKRRVLPVISQIARALPAATISVDTVKASVAAAALNAGAHVVNDVSAFRLDPRMGEICAEASAGVVLMHSRGSVSEMGTYAHAQYEDVVREVLSELRVRVTAARSVGVAPDAIAVDPGIGFAKRGEHSVAILAALPDLAEWGYPIVTGVSRKRFVGEIAGGGGPAERLYGTIGANVAALERGARIFRVHDVAPHRQALDVAWAVVRRDMRSEAQA